MNRPINVGGVINFTPPPGGNVSPFGRGVIIRPLTQDQPVNQVCCFSLAWVGGWGGGGGGGGGGLAVAARSHQGKATLLAVELSP